MDSRLRPGLQFRIRESQVIRQAGLSPHTARGWITHVDEEFISFIIRGSGNTHDVNAKATLKEFQSLFSINPFIDADPEMVRTKPFTRIFLVTPMKK